MTGHQRTKHAIADAMKRLMEKTPLEEIAVGTIIAEAGVSRNTFYYHFRDKYDLVNWIFYSETEQFAQMQIKRSNWQEILYENCRYLRQNKAFYMNALRLTGQNSLQEYLTDYFTKLLSQRLLNPSVKQTPSLSEKDAAFAARFYAYALVGLMVQWSSEGMRTDFTVYQESLRCVLNGSYLEEYLEEVDGESACSGK